jgi:hypothetical protein
MARWIIEQDIDFTESVEGTLPIVEMLRQAHSKGRLTHPEILDLVETAIANKTV